MYSPKVCDLVFNNCQTDRSLRDIGALVEACVADQEYFSNLRQVRISVILGPGPLTGEFDQDYLAYSLDNLLITMINLVARGQVIVTLRREREYPGMTGKTFSIEVQGIPEDDRRPFSRVLPVQVTGCYTPAHIFISPYP